MDAANPQGKGNKRLVACTLAFILQPFSLATEPNLAYWYGHRFNVFKDSTF
jgi:hypothetical protein